MLSTRIEKLRLMRTLLGIAIIGMSSCDSNQTPPGPSPEMGGPTEPTNCPLSANTGTDDVCVTNPDQLDVSSCSRKQIASHCATSWKSNASTMRSKYSSQCEMGVPFKNSTVYFVYDDIKSTGIIDEATNTQYCQGVQVAQDNYSYGSMGSDNIAKGNLYRGEFDQTLRQIRIRVKDFSADCPASDRANAISSAVTELIDNFNGEVSNFTEYDAQGNSRLISFSVFDAPEVDVQCEYDGTTSTSRYECPSSNPMCTSPSSFNTGRIIDPHYILSTPGDKNPGVTKQTIDINIAIVEAARSIDGTPSSAHIKGEIEMAPSELGLFVWYYLNGRSLDVRILTHEIGHALLRFHTQSQGVGTSQDPLHIMNYTYANWGPKATRIPVTPYYTRADDFPSPTGRGGISLYLNRMKLWPTSEGQTVTGSGE